MLLAKEDKRTGMIRFNYAAVSPPPDLIQLISGSLRTVPGAYLYPRYLEKN